MAAWLGGGKGSCGGCTGVVIKTPAMCCLYCNDDGERCGDDMRCCTTQGFLAQWWNDALSWLLMVMNDENDSWLLCMTLCSWTCPLYDLDSWCVERPSLVILSQHYGLPSVLQCHLPPLAAWLLSQPVVTSYGIISTDFHHCLHLLIFCCLFHKNTCSPLATCSVASHTPWTFHRPPSVCLGWETYGWVSTIVPHTTTLSVCCKVLELRQHNPVWAASHGQSSCKCCL